MVSEGIKNAIRAYHQKGYNYKLIHYLLEKRHFCVLSFQYLQKKLIPSLGLKRRGSLTTDLDSVIDLSKKEIWNGVAGSEQLRRTLAIKYQIRITRRVSRELIKLLDCEGLERRQKNRLRRRVYMSKGPNYCWHIDGYDKLTPYGISIHGCIDGRKVIWLKAGITNRRPEVVGKYFLDAVLSEGGLPRRVRGDCGTENVLVAEIMRELSGDDNSFRYGRSTSNQLLEEKDHLQKDNTIHRFCLQYVFMDFINKQLEEVRLLWNHHKIRYQKQGNSMPGIPEILHNETEVYGVMNYMQEVPNIDNYLQRCTTDFLDLDKDFTRLAEEISLAYGLPSPEQIFEFTEAVHVFNVLSDVMQKMIT